jgi:hypothetical protein
MAVEIQRRSVEMLISKTFLKAGPGELSDGASKTCTVHGLLCPVR